MSAFRDFYRGRKVLVTGHTGFKGSWLTHWLLQLGASVTGASLTPQTKPALFDQLGLSGRCDHHILDIRDAAALARLMADSQPEIVFHLAAQPIVRRSYTEAVDTYATNLMGTVHVLESLKTLRARAAAVFVTSDKCYENREIVHGYREDDPLGGYDPYSASKACCELAISSYRNSFFLTQLASAAANSGVGIASARAGNVIGGGDWSEDRLVPDAIRALSAGHQIPIRNPSSTRPWQHVLEPLSGYMSLAAELYESISSPRAAQLATAVNFGPDVDSNRTVQELIETGLKYWPGSWKDASSSNAVHEAGLLHVSIEKAFHLLQWRPAWGFEESVQRTFDWYRAVSQNPGAASDLTTQQISDYVTAAAYAGTSWAKAAPQHGAHVST